MIPKFTAAVALLPLFGAMATAGLLILGGRDAATSTTAINNSVKGVPALMTNIWTGYLGGSKEPTTLYGNSVEVCYASSVKKQNVCILTPLL